MSFLNGANPGIVFAVIFKHKLYTKTDGFSRSQTRTVVKEEEYADHLTNTTTLCLYNVLIVVLYYHACSSLMCFHIMYKTAAQMRLK